MRLACLLPVNLLAFRVSAVQLIGLILVSFLFSFAVDLIQAGLSGRFNFFGAAQQIVQYIVMLLLSFFLAHWYRQPQLAFSIPVVLLAAEVTLSILYLPYSWLAYRQRTSPLVLQAGWVFFTLWFFFIVIRSVKVSLTSRKLRLVIHLGSAAALLILVLWLPHFLGWYRNYDLWVASANQTYANLPRVTNEEVLFAQPTLLQDSLLRLEKNRNGIVDLYFIGFAAYAEQDVFMKDILTAQRLLDQRFGTAGRSLALINNRRTLSHYPMATVSHLRHTLKAIGDLIDADEDLVFIYLSSHGSRKHELSVEFPPLELQQVTPALLAEALKAARIKWKLIVVSACYSGGYIEPLKDDFTLVLTAAQADRVSFGCSYESEATFFGRAYFEQALRERNSFITAFERARELVAQREKEESQWPPSNPQIYVGKAIAEKLVDFERGLAQRDLSAAIP